MRLPRDISSKELIKLLKKLIPNHDPLRLGTLSSIILEVANHFKKSKEEIADQIF